ncbi:MAG TPA: hypothetical protein VII41_03160 [Steroidobacteraceae bacterium]
MSRFIVQIAADAPPLRLFGAVRFGFQAAHFALHPDAFHGFKTACAGGVQHGQLARQPGIGPGETQLQQGYLLDGERPV